MKASISGIDLAPGHGNNNVVVDNTIVSYIFHIAGDMRVSTFLTTCINTTSSRSWGALLSAYNPGNGPVMACSRYWAPTTPYCKATRVYHHT